MTAKDPKWRVRVLVPCYKEDIEVLEKTLTRAVRALHVGANVIDEVAFAEIFYYFAAAALLSCFKCWSQGHTAISLAWIYQHFSGSGMNRCSTDWQCRTKGVHTLCIASLSLSPSCAVPHPRVFCRAASTCAMMRLKSVSPKDKAFILHKEL